MSGLPTPAQVAAFARDGAVVLRGVLTAHEVAVARAGVEQVLAQPGPLAVTASNPGDPGRFVEDFRRWQDVTAIGQAARLLMGSTQARLHHDHVLVKEARTQQRTPWHQDQPYYGVTGRQVVSLWIPLDPVPVESCLQVVAGTHHGPWFVPVSFLSGEARWFPADSLARLPDFDADLAVDPDAWEVLAWALEPGDAVAFHALAVHGAAGTVGRRRVLSLRYVGDDARHAVRQWRTSPPFPELEGVLADGAPLHHPLFPVVAPTG